MINNGQSCIAAKRFIIHDNIYDEFVKQFVARVSAIAIGDPMDEKTELGPLATEAIREGLDEQVKASVAKGARVLTGGKKLDREGYYYAPTVLVDIPSECTGRLRRAFWASCVRVQGEGCKRCD